MVAELQVPQDQLAHWLEELSQYHMVIQHRPGCRYCNVDALSCLPMPLGGCGTRLEVHPSDLPCGGCPKCIKAHESWSAFAEKVDDVGLLSKPGCWSYSPDMGECPNPELSEAVAVGEEPGVSQAEESVTLEPWGMFRGACWAGTAAPCPGRWTSRSQDAIPYPTLAKQAPHVCVRAGFGSGGA